MKVHFLDSKKPDFYIGIDTGVNTGYAVWHPGSRELVDVRTIPIHKAMDKIKEFYGTNVLVRVEDARKRKWFGKAGRDQLQGAGSIKRDAKIFEDFLTDVGIPFELVAPKNNKTKLTAESFKKITKWKGKTNVHNRDAAMLVFGL